MHDSILSIAQSRLPRHSGHSAKTGLRLWKLQGRLVIRELANASGNVSFRLDVPAKISGKRRQLQFLTFAEAQAEAVATLEHKEQNGRAGFALSRQQYEDATRALASLQPFGVSLEDAANYFAKHERPKQGDITLSALVDLYVEEKRKGTNAKGGLPVRERSLLDIKSRLGMFSRTHGGELVKHLREEQVKGWLFSNQDICAQTRVNNFRNLRAFFNYAVSRGYIAENPLTHIKVGAEGKAPVVLSVDQCSALLTQALNHRSLALLPYVALGMFCGVRSEELSKLEWSHVNLAAGSVTIPATIAKKRRIRIVKMPECCKAWIVASGASQEGLIRPLGFEGRFRALVKASGFAEWPVNALRHSAASYHYQKHSNASLTCAMLGQRSDDVLFTHYRSLVTPDDAERFFNLLPPAVDGVIRMAS